MKIIINQQLTKLFTHEINNFIEKNNEIPLIILDFKYNYLSQTAYNEGLLELRDNILYSTNKSPFLEEQVFACYIFCNEKIKNYPVIYSKKFYFSNNKANVNDIRINNVSIFDSKFYYFDLDSNNSISVFTNKGYKTAYIKTTKDEYVVNDQFPNPNETIELSNGELGLWQACGYNDLLIRKPILIVEGFDPLNDRNFYITQHNIDIGKTDRHLYNVANDEGIADYMRAQGFDVLILNFEDGGADIITNAMTTVEAINYINANKIYNNELMVMGPSMGALIARYALTYMEDNNMEHYTKLYFSFDGPHQGANITLGLQHLANFATNTVLINNWTSVFDQLVNCQAAKQMLIYHYTGTNWTTPDNNPAFDDFYSELHSLNSGIGYPTKCRNIALVNGSSTGISANNFDAGDNLFTGVAYFPFNWIGIPTQLMVYLRYNALPDNQAKTIFQGLVAVKILGKWIPLNANLVVINNNLSLDKFPASKQEFHKMANGYFKKILFSYSNEDFDAFIPVKSSMDVSYSDWVIDYTNPNQTDFVFINNTSITYDVPMTPFDEIYMDDSCEYHVIGSLDLQSAPWLIENIAPSDLKLQNHIVTYDTRYETLNTITVGRNVTNKTFVGDFVLSENTHTEFIAGKSLYFDVGFNTNGGTCETQLIDISCEVINQNNKFQTKSNNDFSVNYADTNKIEEQKDFNKIKIYPNPATNIITIDLQENKTAEIQIFDLTGKMIIHEVIFYKDQFDLSNITNGLILIKVISDDEIKSFKIIKK